MAAVFIEVDGVLIAPPNSATALDGIVLLPGVAAALARFRLRGISVVVIADAPATMALFPLLGEHLKRLVADQGGELAAVYAATATAPASWRKPRPGMLLAAAREHAIDLSQTWMVGRSDADAQAAGQAGCAGCVLVHRTELPVQDYGLVVAVASNLADAPRVMIPRAGGCWHQ